MILPRDAAAQVESYRSLVELRLSVLLGDGAMTVDQYKLAIFNRPHNLDFRRYLFDALDGLGTNVDEASEELISVIQDAWNYFPHRALDGRCPAEVVLEQQICQYG